MMNGCVHADKNQQLTTRKLLPVSQYNFWKAVPAKHLLAEFKEAGI
jgi:hypothetical protein